MFYRFQNTGKIDIEQIVLTVSSPSIFGFTTKLFDVSLKPK